MGDIKKQLYLEGTPENFFLLFQKEKIPHETLRELMDDRQMLFEFASNRRELLEAHITEKLSRALNLTEGEVCVKVILSEKI